MSSFEDDITVYICAVQKKYKAYIWAKNFGNHNRQVKKKVKLILILYFIQPCIFKMLFQYVTNIKAYSWDIFTFSLKSSVYFKYSLYPYFWCLV